MLGKKILRNVLFVLATMPFFSALALINPNFTPVTLVDESQQIWSLALKKGDKDLVFTGENVTVLKGDKPDKALVFDCGLALNEDTGKYLADHINRFGSGTVLLFTGKFSDEDNEGGMGHVDGDDTQKFFLHVGGKWIDTFLDDDGKTLGLLMVNSHMEGTWAGSSDMLLRAVKYKLADPSADFPVVVGASWRQPVKVGSVAGALSVRGVDIGSDGKNYLWVTSDKGDRLLAYDNAFKGVKDVTESKKFTAKTAVGAWGDFNGDGTLDLASYDGKTLALHAQKEDGTFEAKTVGVAAEALSGCKTILALDAGQTGQASLLICGAAAPKLIKNINDGKIQPIADGWDQASDFGNCAVSLIADLDNDNIADVLCIFERGSLLFKGKGNGVFDKGVKTAIAGGMKLYNACLADFDSDGRLDVFTVCEERARIWQNEGGNKFAEYLNVSGEIAYISKPNCIDCVTCDVNNDGLQDVLMVYNDIGAQIFFNRGFRSFGHAHGLDIGENQLLEIAEHGQKSGCIFDMDGDGGQDMVLLLPNDELWFFQRSDDDGQPLAAIAALPAKHAFKGPVSVTGWVGDRLLGAWSIMPGTSDAFFGVRDAGVVTIKWQIPGSDKAEKSDLQIESKARRLKLR